MIPKFIIQIYNRLRFPDYYRHNKSSRFQHTGTETKAKFANDNQHDSDWSNKRSRVTKITPWLKNNSLTSPFNEIVVNNVPVVIEGGHNFGIGYNHSSKFSPKISNQNGVLRISQSSLNSEWNPFNNFGNAHMISINNLWDNLANTISISQSNNNLSNTETIVNGNIISSNHYTNVNQGLVKVTVPPETVLSYLEVTDDNNQFKISNVTINDVDLSGNNGDIDLNNLRAIHIQLNGNNGDANIFNSVLEQVDAYRNNGDINLSNNQIGIVNQSGNNGDFNQM